MPAATNAGLSHLQSIAKKGNSITEEDYAGYPVNKINGRLYISFFGKLTTAPNWDALLSKGAIKGSTTRNIATVKIPLQEISNIQFEEVFAYLEIPGLAAPHLDKALFGTRTDSVHQGINLPQKYTGKNVIIGITDTGFDYTHPMFYDTLMQQTRILAAWDQFKSSGPSPSNYGYGAEYNTPESLLAAGGDTSNIYGYDTHGTHVAGIAGGGGAGTIYRGMAPSADLLFATFYFDEASAIDSFHWMKEKAQAENKRLVINMSWGLFYMGTLDGNSILSQVIDAMSEDDNIVFVSSAGNNGNDLFHIKKTFNDDSLTTRVRFDDYSNPKLWGQSITMWGEPFQAFEAKIGVYSNGNFLYTESPYFNTASANPYTVDTLVTSSNDSIFYNVTVDAQHPLNDKPHIRLRVKCTNTNLRVGLSARAESGTVHFWNVVELTNGVGNWGMPFTGFGPASIPGDSNYGVSDPACTHSVITVGAYSSEYPSNGSIAGGQIAYFSSAGPLISGEMKPDISAPGVSVISSLSSFAGGTPAAFQTIEFNGNTYKFGSLSGTSMSSPCVAGIVAILLEADPTLNPEDVKFILKENARQDNFTGTITVPGDIRWGYGKVNTYKSIKSIVGDVRVDEQNQSDRALRIAPNPVSESFVIQLPQNEDIKKIDLISVDGKQVSLQTTGHVVICSSLPPGFYLVRIETSSTTQQIPFVKL